MEPSWPRMEEKPDKALVERLRAGSKTVSARLWLSLPRALVAAMAILKVPVLVAVPLIVAPEFVSPPGNPEKLKLSAAGLAVAVKLKGLRK